jgi:serine/threonine protein kinase
MAFELVAGRGIKEAVSVEHRFRVLTVSAAPSDPTCGTQAPVGLAGGRLGEARVDELDFVDGPIAVYKGQRPKDGVAVTIKAFSLSGPSLDELKALAARIEGSPRVRSEFVERVYEHGRVGELFFVVLERVEGESLEERVERDGGLPSSVVAEVVVAVAHGLHDLHERDRVHGQLCPRNLLLTPDGHVKVVGVGQGYKAQQPAVLVGLEGADPDYVAPERIDGRAAGPASDIYALGHVLYYLLCGRAPFAGNSAVATMICHLSEPLPDLKRQVDGLSVGLETILGKMTGKTLDLRYRTAQQLLDDLQIYRAGRGRALEPFPEPPPPATRARVARTRFLLVGALMLSLLLAHAAVLAVRWSIDPVSFESGHSLVIEGLER